MELLLKKTHKKQSQIVQKSRLLLQLLNSIPDIEVDLDWDNDCGTYQNDLFEIECEPFFITCQLNIIEIGKPISQTYYQPGEYHAKTFHVDVNYIEVWYNDILLELSETETQKITNTIIKNINQ